MSWKGVGAKCEAAGAKCVLKSYVDAGNNLLTSEDIYHALHYGNGIQNAEISVVAIDAKNSMSSSKTTIPKISQYHSFEYFGTGLGKRWNYTGAKFQPAIQIVLPFSATSKQNHINSKSKRPRLDRSNNSLKFCPEIGCSKAFEDDASLEEHLLLEQHNLLITKSMVDRAKDSYITRMKSLFSESSLQSSTPSISDSPGKVSAFSTIYGEGWALPLRKQFRYTKKQKKLLFEIFMAGEESGKKMSP